MLTIMEWGDYHYLSKIIGTRIPREPVFPYRFSTEFLTVAPRVGRSEVPTSSVQPVSDATCRERYA